MGDDYQVIARSVRRPMRRWWKRIGSWWIALIVALLILKAIASLFENLYTMSIFGGAVPPPLLFPEPFKPLLYTVVPLAGLLWVLAAGRAMSAVDEFAQEVPQLVDDPRFLVYRFRLAVAQALWPAVLAAISLSDLLFALCAHFTKSLWRPTAEVLDAIASLGGGFNFLILILWLAALIIHGTRLSAVVWLCWFALVCGEWYRAFAGYLLTGIFGLYRPNSAWYNWHVIDESGLILACFAFSALAVYLIALRRRSGLVLAAILGIIAVLSTLDVGPPPGDPTRYSLARFLIDSFGTYVYALPHWEPVAQLQAKVYTKLTLVEASTLSYSVSFNAPEWLCWIALPFQALIAYGYYWFIRWLLVLGASRRAAGT